MAKNASVSYVLPLHMTDTRQCNTQLGFLSRNDYWEIRQVAAAVTNDLDETIIVLSSFNIDAATDGKWMTRKHRTGKISKNCTFLVEMSSIDSHSASQVTSPKFQSKIIFNPIVDCEFLALSNIVVSHSFDSHDPVTKIQLTVSCQHLTFRIWQYIRERDYKRS